MDVCKGQSSFEEWVATWNNSVDQQAVQLKLSRSQKFWQLLAGSDQWYREQRDAICTLRAFYLAVAERRQEAIPTPEVVITLMTPTGENESMI